MAVTSGWCRADQSPSAGSMDATGDSFRPLATCCDISARSRARRPRPAAPTAAPNLRARRPGTATCSTTSASSGGTRKTGGSCLTRPGGVAFSVGGLTLWSQHSIRHLRHLTTVLGSTSTGLGDPRWSKCAPRLDDYDAYYTSNCIYIYHLGRSYTWGAVLRTASQLGSLERRRSGLLELNSGTMENAQHGCLGRRSYRAQGGFTILEV